jgi:signal transduction histidine kinase
VVADADGTVRIWAAADPAKVRDAGVRIFVGMAKESLVAPANARFYDDLRTLSISSGLLFVGVWILAELGIRRPVGRISAAAARLGQGDFSTRIPMRYPKGELGDLMAVLNATAEALERKRDAIDALNRMLRQSQKLEMIGQLTGGIAHDFNNLLTVILGNAEMMSAGAGGDARLRVAAAATIQAAERGAELTKRLLAFARRQPLEPTAIDVNRQIADMGDLLIRALGEGIELKIVPADGVWHALADPGQVESAVLNLCVNARDAMPHGGRLTLETKNVVLDAAYAARQSEVLPGQYVMIAVSDSGTGMDADTLERAFEPFFTTKEVGKGSGLGLSMVYGFAKQSGGHVRIYSEPGQGTTVRLYLPRVEAGAAAGLPAPKPPPSRRGTEKILVVEDDELVRASVCGQLAALDYRIVAAGDGPAALEILARDADFDLMFTDIVIPGDCDGFELAGRARKLRPGLPVLFTSGYTENALQHTSRLDLGADFIQKPYRQSELAEKIRAVLGQT